MEGSERDVRVHRIILSGGPEQVTADNVHSTAKRELSELGDVRIEDYRVDDKHEDLFHCGPQEDPHREVTPCRYQPVTVVLVRYRTS